MSTVLVMTMMKMTLVQMMMMREGLNPLLTNGLHRL